METSCQLFLCLSISSSGEVSNLSDFLLFFDKDSPIVFSYELNLGITLRQVFLTVLEVFLCFGTENEPLLSKSEASLFPKAKFFDKFSLL